MKFLITAACLSVALGACSPKAVVRAVQHKSLTPVAEGFVVIKETEPFNAASQELGDIHIKDAGLTLLCDYEAVVELATKEARQLGANVLRIYEHRTPSLYGSSCHRIRAKALRVDDITPYEKEIIWHPTRRLQQADFKGSIESRPFEAATSSNIRYRYVVGPPILRTVQYTIETYFDCQNSYFKGNGNTAYTLAHEQVHFDITEIYARQLVKAIQEQVTDTQGLEQKQQALYERLMREAQLLQDKYDSEVYEDRSKLAGWQTKVQQELTALQPYAAKQFTLKIKR